MEIEPQWVRQDLNSPTGRGVRIGIIDSGWDRTLEDVKIRPGVGLVDPDDDLKWCYSDDDQDRIGHGTACTNLILRIAPEATLYPIRVFGHQLETSASTIQAALHWAIRQELHLVNLSLGTLRTDALKPFYALCEAARRSGLIIVAAIHNWYMWSYPAIFDNVISVGSADVVSPFAYYYRQNEAVECLAKSAHRVSSLGGKEVKLGGTSFAAPVITGIIALFLERYPKASLEDIRSLLERYALST